MSGCAYDQYDPKTFEPLNRETALRIAELGWSEADFAGRSVLDIGCNTGLLSVLACKLGAARVRAMDVSSDFVDGFARIAAARNLPVSVEKRAFDKINPGEHSADVVLFMEVIHWTTSQGIPIPEAMKRLMGLTRETLYFEFPWSVDEPSIRAQTDLTAETYSADLILAELTRYFANVRIVSFMHYFGHGSGSKRALVRASDKRPEAEVLAHLPDATILPSTFRRGRHGISIANSPAGLFAIKSVPEISALHKLDDDLLNAIFSATPARALVGPVKLGAGYSVRNDAGARLMAFPLILNDHRLAPDYKPLKPADVIVLAEELARDFAPLAPLARAMTVAGLDYMVKRAMRHLPERIGEALFLNPEQRSAVARGAVTAQSRLDWVAHLDLQAGNIACDQTGRMRVVDLDNIGLATAYTDGLLGLMWAGGQPSDIDALEQKLEPIVSRQLEAGDIIAALAIGFGWRAAADGIGAAITSTDITQFEVGVTALAHRLESF